MASYTEENYLKTLFHLANEQGEVNVKELAEVLKLKMPTVTSMMKKLAQKKLVHYQSYKPLKLTSAGEKEAGLIIRKHRLTEMFLVEKMGFSWEKVHEIAEQVEHVKAPLFFQRMDEMLGTPQIDPHGSPIPDKEGKMVLKSYDKMSDCKAGEKLVLKAVLNSQVEFLSYLNSRDLKLGTQMTIKEVETFDGSMVVTYGGDKAETLSNMVCERLLVEKVK